MPICLTIAGRFTSNIDAISSAFSQIVLSSIDNSSLTLPSS
ncbi:hypothetical protein [Francisella noatunensis]|nr:hypothetical protein [Francisella noatunensis]